MWTEVKVPVKDVPVRVPMLHIGVTGIEPLLSLPVAAACQCTLREAELMAAAAAFLPALGRPGL